MKQLSDKIHILITIDQNNPSSYIDQLYTMFIEYYKQFSDVEAIVITGDKNDIKILLNPNDFNIKAMDSVNIISTLMKERNLSISELTKKMRSITIKRLLSS